MLAYVKRVSLCQEEIPTTRLQRLPKRSLAQGSRPTRQNGSYAGNRPPQMVPRPGIESGMPG